MSDNVLVIAEAGVNHNGSLDIALELVSKATEAGANIIKFQTFKAERLVTQSASKAAYQKKMTGEQESQFEMLRKLELSDEDHKKIIEQCNKFNIQFLSSPFDCESVDFLVADLGLQLIKIPSGEITNGPMLLKIARLGCDVILSSGMSTLADIEQALAVLAFGYLQTAGKPRELDFRDAYSSAEGQELFKEKVTLLHCTTEYPAPFEDVNLRVMNTLQSAFNVRVGYSDHTPGIVVPIVATARGAKVIEKHFTLDKEMTGPDHKASLNAEELKQMVDAIRVVEKTLGQPIKIVSPSERGNAEVARKSIVAAKPIKKGEKFTAENLTIKRPGSGLSPMYYWKLEGQAAEQDYVVDTVIKQ